MIAKVVKDSPAERDGLKVGDVILEVNGTDIEDTGALRKTIGRLKKGDEAKLDYFDLVEDGADAVYSMRNGQPNDDHNYWKGFASGTAVGLIMEHLQAGE